MFADSINTVPTCTAGTSQPLTRCSSWSWRAALLPGGSCSSGSRILHRAQALTCCSHRHLYVYSHVSPVYDPTSTSASPLRSRSKKCWAKAGGVRSGSARPLLPHSKIGPAIFPEYSSRLWSAEKSGLPTALQGGG
eukprot:SAG22_NODE_360_length_11744_cov_37.781623_5_plen_136_part_00